MPSGTEAKDAQDRAVRIRVTNDVTEVDRLLSEGFCPVECALGERSVVDELRLDHHGDLSDLEPVGLRAYRNHYAERADDPRFVVAGSVDADASFCIAALAGRLPHPDRDVSPLPARLAEAYRQDLDGLAETIALIDGDPVGRDLREMAGGGLLLLWNALTEGRSELGAIGGVALWERLTTMPHAHLDPYLAAARESERARREIAEREWQRATVVGGGRILLLDEPEVAGFDVWYGRLPDREPKSVAGWRHPVVLARSPSGAVTIGCPNRTVARSLFGPDSLRALYPLLRPQGWGGRDTVGGSPRGTFIDSADLPGLAAVVIQAMQSN